MTSHECMKCKAIGDWSEVYYDQFLCGICINGKCDVCQCDIIDRQHGMDFCEPCFDRFKITETIKVAFKPSPTYVLGSYYGKHILENSIGRDVTETEFMKIMSDLGYKRNKNNKYKLVERKPRKRKIDYMITHCDHCGIVIENLAYQQDCCWTCVEGITDANCL